MAQLEYPKGTAVSNAKAATAGDFFHQNNGQVQVPGQSGPFKEYLFPGMGDSRRFNIGGIRNATGDIEGQLGRYAVQGIPQNAEQKRTHGGPIATSTVMGDEIEGWTQTLNLLAALHANTAHEIATMKVPRFWINQIKSESWKPFNGWESRVTIFRGGLLHQSGLSNWRRIMPVPTANINNPSTFPGFETVMSTTEELTGCGYETGWGSENINIDYLRNCPNAAQSVKEQLDMGVDMAIALRETYNRETYANLACLMHRAFVMCCDCEPSEDVGSRIFIFDSHIAPDAVEVSGSSDIAAIRSGTYQGRRVINPDLVQPEAPIVYIAPVDDRADFTNSKVWCVLDGRRCDVYGQFHAMAENVTDPTTGIPMPFMLIDAGPANETLEVEPLNFDMLERVTDDLESRCLEQAVGRDGDSPIFAATIRYEDIDKLIRATPMEWDAWRRAEPQALITHYGISKAKVYRRWAIVHDTNQLRFKPIAYIPEYTEAVAAGFGYVGWRDGDDEGLKGRAVYVCTVVNPKMLSPKRKGTNGYKVPVNNPEYHDAPIALMNVFIKDTFINQLEGQAPSIGMGTDFGPLPPCNGSWGFLNIQDKATNPFRQNGNFYGLLRTHVKPTRYTQDSIAFVYARDVRAFKAFTQAENKVINPDYTGMEQAAKVIGLKLTGDAKVVKFSKGKALEFTLANSPHLVLATGSLVKIGKQDTDTGAVTGEKDFVVLNAGAWPRVVLAPVADIQDAGDDAGSALAALGITDTYTDGKHTVTFDGTVVVAR